MGLLTAILSPNRQTRSIENPTVSLANADEWFIDLMAGGSADSGVRVNTDTALEYSPVWRAVTLISGDVAKLPLLVYERVQIGGSEGKRRARDHRAWRLLKNKPNREMAAYPFKQTLQMRAMLEGNGYAFILRREDSTPAELLPLNTDRTFPVRVNGKLWYVTTVNDEKRRIPPEDMFHIKGPGDGLEGMSVIGKARNSIGLGLAAEKHTSKFFKQGARPSVVLRHPSNLSDEAAARLLSQWEKMHTGLENAHRTAILEENMEAQTLTMSAKDMQWLETREFGIRDVANWFGVPPHKLGDTTRTSFSSLEQENRQYLDEALDPWLVSWEQECWDKLLTEPQKQRDSHTVEFERKALLRADTPTRGEFYVKATGGAPWMSRNEVRAAENMNPIEGFDEIPLPSSLFAPETQQGAEGGGQDEEAASSESEVDVRAIAEGQRDVIRQLVRQQCKRIQKQAEGKAKRQADFEKLVRDKIDDWREVAQVELENVVTVSRQINPEAPSAVHVAADLIDTAKHVLENADRSNVSGAMDEMVASFPDRVADQLLPPDDGNQTLAE